MTDGPSFSPSTAPSFNPTFTTPSLNPTFTPSFSPTPHPTLSQATKTNFFATITYPINFNQVGFNSKYEPLPEFEFGINGKAQYDYSKSC